MIPVKIISQEKAIELGLKKRKKKGEGVIMAGTIAKKNGEIMEKNILKPDGTKEILFLHEERKKDLIEKSDKYFSSFDKILGKDNKTFLKENNLKIREENE